MNNELRKVRSHPIKFFTSWIVANFSGGYIIGFLENNGLQYWATLFLTGAIIGSLQWGVLRRLASKRFRWWPLSSAVGWILGTYLIVFSQLLHTPISAALLNQFGLWEVFWANLVAAPIGILAVALNQSFMINKTHFSPIWLLSSLIGATAQSAISSIACAAICRSATTAGIASGLGWSIYGVITGVAFLFLFAKDSHQ